VTCPALHTEHGAQWCLAGRQKGPINAAVCLVCDTTRPPPIEPVGGWKRTAPLTVRGVLAGAAAVAGVAMGLDAARHDTVEARTAICKACTAEHGTGNNCPQCRCFVWYKVRVASQECGWHKWGAESPA